jgi:hypothetical protein
VDTHAGHLSGFLAGFDVGERIVEGCGREVRLHDVVRPARAPFTN